MYNINDICRESVVIVDNKTAFTSYFSRMINENFSRLKNIGAKFYFHNSVNYYPETWNPTTILILQQNNMAEFFGSGNYQKMTQDTLAFIVKNCTKSKISLITREFRLGRNAESVNQFESVSPLGVTAITQDRSIELQSYSVMDYNNIGVSF
jgi:hypothetical protein